MMFEIKATVTHKRDAEWPEGEGYESTVEVPTFYVDAYTPAYAITQARTIVAASSVDLLDVCDDVDAHAMITAKARYHDGYEATEYVNLRPEV